MDVSTTTVKKSSDSSFHQEEKEFSSVRHRSTMDQEEINKLLNESGNNKMTWDSTLDPSFKMDYTISSEKSFLRVREPVRPASRGNAWKKLVLVLLLMAAIAAGFYYLYLYVI